MNSLLLFMNRILFTVGKLKCLKPSRVRTNFFFSVNDISENQMTYIC